jgi:hypothetical protein
MPNAQSLSLVFWDKTGMEVLVMGEISLNKLAGWSMILGPIVALVCYFLQPGGMLIDAANPSDAMASIGAIKGNAFFASLTGIVIPIAMIVFATGIQHFIESMRGGNGHAIGRIGVLFILMSVASWVVGSAISVGIIDADMSVVGSMYGIAFSVNTVAGILFGIGGLLVALAASSRDENNSIFAYIAGLAALVAAICSIVTGIDSTQAQTMQAITGICFIVFTIWSIVIGRSMCSSS